MKKLPKISLCESSDSENLNLAKSQSRIESGYIDGYCYFSCLEYLNYNVYQESSMTTGSYMLSYLRTYKNENGETINIEDLRKTGVPESNVRDFTKRNFAVSDVGIGSLSTYFSSTNRSVLAGINTVNGGHMVVVLGYNSTTNKYSYYDPANPTEILYISGTEFQFVLGVTGVK